MMSQVNSSLESQSSQSPEMQLLLTCATTHLSDSARTRIQRLVQSNLNWTVLIIAATYHRLVPLLYKNLVQCPRHDFPDGFLKHLRYLSQKTALKNLYLSQQLTSLLDLFREHGISVLPYKGPSLALSAYGSLSLRQFCDLDLLVHPDDIPNTVAILTQVGYEMDMNLEWEYHFSSPDESVQLDLHESIVPFFFSLPKDFITPENQQLKPEDALLLLSCLLVKDCCHWKIGIGQLCDISELLRTHPNLDWDWIVAKANKSGCERILAFALRLTQSTLDTPLPSAMAGLIDKHQSIANIVENVQLRIVQTLSPPEEDVEEPGFWEYLQNNNHRLHLQLRERWREKILYCLYWSWKIVLFVLKPNQADWSTVPLPRMLSFLYYPFHPIRLVFKHGIMRIYTQMAMRRK